MILAGEGEPLSLARKVVPPPPGPLPFPKRALFRRLEGCGDADAFPVPTVPRKNEERTKAGTLSERDRLSSARERYARRHCQYTHEHNL